MAPLAKSGAKQRADRALELFEKGIGIPAISERLGLPATRVHNLIGDARRRRLAAEKVEAVE